MAKLIYSAIASLDGYVVDEDGRFDWAAPGEDLHALVNDLQRPVGTYLYGRRMYEVMTYWETAPVTGDGVEAGFARLWKAADKVVYSTTLAEVTTARTRLERDFDAGAVRRLKESAASDVGIGGPTIAAEAFRAGLVDECQLFFVPVLAGGGTPALPAGVRLRLDLADHRRFEDGSVHLRYSVVGDLPRTYS